MAVPREMDQPAPAKRRRTRNRIVVYSGAGKKAQAKAAAADVTEIALSKARYRRVAARRRFYERLFGYIVDKVERAEREGLTSLELSIVDEVVASKAAAQTKPIDAAIARARARGQAKATVILKGADMLTARQLGPIIGISHETVNVRRRKGEVLGLEGPTRGYKYPRWQVTDDGMPLPGLARVFGVLGGQPWTVYRFLRTAHAELGGRTALDALKAGQIEAVVEVAENQAAGAFS